MTKLFDTQRVILSKAAQNDALLAEPPADACTVSVDLAGSGRIDKYSQQPPCPLSFRVVQHTGWVLSR